MHYVVTSHLLCLTNCPVQTCSTMWVQSCAGIEYLFGSQSPVIKSTLGYNQRPIATLGVAKDLSDIVGFLARSLCEILPFRTVLLIRTLQNLIEYSWAWLIVTGRVPSFAYVDGSGSGS